MIENTLAYKIKHIIPKTIREFSYKFPLCSIYILFISVPYILAHFFDTFMWITYVISFFLGTYFEMFINGKGSSFIQNPNVVYILSVLIFSIIYYLSHRFITFYNLKNRNRHKIYIVIIIINLIWNLFVWSSFTI